MGMGIRELLVSSMRDYLKRSATQGILSRICRSNSKIGNQFG